MESQTLILDTLRQTLDMNKRDVLPFKSVSSGSVCSHTCSFWNLSHEAKTVSDETVSIHLYLRDLLLPRLFLPSTQKMSWDAYWVYIVKDFERSLRQGYSQEVTRAVTEKAFFPCVWHLYTCQQVHFWECTSIKMSFVCATFLCGQPPPQFSVLWLLWAWPTSFAPAPLGVSIWPSQVPFFLVTVIRSRIDIWSTLAVWGR